jgi:phosphatidate phosphatase LPIN
VEFRVNGVKQDFSMKLGEGGEAFFIFETTDDVPVALQTSPLVSPAASPKPTPGVYIDTSSLQEPDYLDLDRSDSKRPLGLPIRSSPARAASDLGATAEMPWVIVKRTIYSDIKISFFLYREHHPFVAISR